MLYRVIGLMSGTSADGVDAAYIETDGLNEVQPGPAISVPYAPEFRTRLLAAMGPRNHSVNRWGNHHGALERELTLRHAEAVERLKNEAGPVDLIGFHGQTLFHDPGQRVTVQIGDGALLAQLTRISVINDFRTADVLAGGQGAPLVPLYHASIASKLPKPCVIANIGGVANITYLGASTLACDTGPGNALIDDAMLRLFGMPFDEDGHIAAQGKVHEALVSRWLQDSYFTLPLPKSLDRNHFATTASLAQSHLSPYDQVATLTEFTAASLAQAAELLPETPRLWIITGGGRKNQYLMKRLQDLTKAEVVPIESMGFDGDALEAQAFAYLAVRSRLGLPLSLPTTTGAPHPTTGGRYWPTPWSEQADAEN